jgi:long-chain acyl-CoA synthetase
MAWVGDALYSTVMSLLVGFTCNCPESPRTLLRDLRELGPTAFLGPPRIWENLLTSVQVKAADATPLKRKIFEIFRDLAARAELRRSDGRPVPPLMRLGLAVGDVLVFGPVRDQLGLGRVRWAYTGGAPLGPDAFRFFRSFGINLKQIYGVTELCGVTSVQPDSEADPNTVGRMCRGIDVQIASNGEVLVRSPGAFRGYYRELNETQAALTEHGWLRTGDAGFVDSRGHLVVIDRPSIPREQAQIQPLYQRGRHFWRRSRVRRRNDRHQFRDGRQMGRTSGHFLYVISGFECTSRGASARPRRNSKV